MKLAKFKRTTFQARFPNEDAASDWGMLNGWKLETTERMERGVVATFSA